MPGMGRSDYWWRKYHEAVRRGASKEQAAKSASIAEKKHKAKARRKR